jgi:SAM-dependent methyltransferase
MFTHSAEIYDILYRPVKKYSVECQQLTTLLKQLHPYGKTILDVGCGTGEHARILAGEHGYRVDGIDIEPAFIKIAAEKNPRGQFWQADMRDFRLARQYDIIICLFGSIAYVRTEDSIITTLMCMKNHLRPGGVILIEPWLTPDRWQSGRVDIELREESPLKVVRMNHTSRKEKISRIHFEYLVGSPEGIQHFAELHELGLFTIDELLRCFQQSGLGVEYDPKGLIDRGLLIARTVD